MSLLGLSVPAINQKFLLFLKKWFVEIFLATLLYHRFFRIFGSREKIVNDIDVDININKKPSVYIFFNFSWEKLIKVYGNKEQSITLSNPPLPRKAVKICVDINRNRIELNINLSLLL